VAAVILPESAAPKLRFKPQLTFFEIWNMCFGFLGLQFGFALQNANVSRIFQTLGASLDQIPVLWVAAPLTGLIVQPIIGYFSDRTWTRIGRRRPYFLAGAVLASLALLAMPRSQALWVAAALLWILDASINVAMEPFRAFVGDQLGQAQRPSGYAMQSFFIGLGAIVASMLPWLLARAGVNNMATVVNGVSTIPDTVRLSFNIGSAVLLLAVLWTVWRTREYPPEILRSFGPVPDADPVPVVGGRRFRGWLWIAIGLAALFLVRYAGLNQELYLVGTGALLWGIALAVYSRVRGPAPFRAVMGDIEAMPDAMRRLIPVQFFSWLALFAMWIYTTAAVAQHQFGSVDPQSVAYNEGANWVGVLFAAYNGFAALAAVVIPWMVRRVGMRVSHLINLILGGCALASFLLIRNPNWLLLSMVGVGFAWASILSLPYALLSDSVPAHKMGVYMGIFNIFIVIPQILAASVLGLLLKVLFAGAPIYALVLGGASFVMAGLLVLRVPHSRVALSA
jgi:maltose/moltooligosaccharide transporter